MVDWWFPDFLENSETYERATLYWRTLWENVRSAVNGDQAWHSPWLTNPDRDGNPIFTAVCPTLRRGVRIIQEIPPAAGETDLDWWVDDFADENGGSAVRELVISCCPSQENIGPVEGLLR